MTLPVEQTLVAAARGALTLLAVALPLPTAALVLAPLRGTLALRLTALLGLWLVLLMLAVAIPGLLGALAPAPVALALALLASPLAWPRSRARAWSTLGDLVRAGDALRRQLGGAERLALAGVAAVGTAALATALLAPSRDYDTWMYQLPQVAEWIQHGYAASQEQWRVCESYGNGIVWYPGDWTTLPWLACAGLGCDVWALLPNLLAWILLGAGAVGLAQGCGARPAAARIAGALVMTLPMAGANLASAHVDLAQGAFLTAALALGVHGARGRDRTSGWLALILAAVLVGTKMSGIPQLALLALLGLAAWRRASPPLVPAPAPARLLPVIAGAAVAALAAWWYARNWWWTGNPLGFLAVPRWHWPGTIDAAYVRRTSLLHAFQPSRLAHWRLLAAALAAAIGALPLLGAIAAARLVARPDRLGRALVVAAAVLAWLYVDGPWSGKQATDPDLSWWMMQQLRYTWGLWAVVAVMVGVAVRPGREEAVLVAATLGAAVAACSGGGTPWAGVPGAVVGAGVAWAGTAGVPAWSGRRWGAVGVALLLVLTAIGRPLRAHLLDTRGFGVPGYLATHTVPGEPVAFWGSHLSWLLYGEDLRREVTYLMLDRWQAAGATDRAAATLAGALAGRGVHLLALGPKWVDFHPETYHLIEDHPASFRLVHGDPAVWGMCLYAVVPPSPRGEGDAVGAGGELHRP